MGVIVRQSIVTTIISYAGTVIGAVNLLYLYPKFFSPEQVGVMRTLQDAAILMAQFAQFGLAQSVIRFFPRFYSSAEDVRRFFTFILALALLIFGIFLLVYFAFEAPILSYFQQNAADFIQYSKLALFMTFVTVYTTLFEVFARSLLKNIVPNLLKEVVSRLLLALLALSYFMGLLNFEQVMFLSVMIYVLCLVILCLYLYLGRDFSVAWSPSLIPIPVLREILLFSFLSFAGTAGLIIIGKVDSLMVAGLLGLAPVAIYTISFYMATVIEIPKRSITQVATPLISRGFEKNDIADIKKIYQKTALNQFILGSLLLMGIIANLDSIFILMPKGEIYAAGKAVVIIVGAGKLVDMLFGPSSEIILYSKHYWFNIVLILVLAVVMVSANNLLIPAFGIEGAAISVTLTLTIFNAIKFIYIWMKIDLQPFSVSFVKVTLTGAAAWVCQLLIPGLNPVIADIFVRSLVITSVFGSLIYWSAVSPEANLLAERALDLIRRKSR